MKKNETKKNWTQEGDCWFCGDRKHRHSLYLDQECRYEVEYHSGLMWVTDKDSYDEDSASFEVNFCPFCGRQLLP